MAALLGAGTAQWACEDSLRSCATLRPLCTLVDVAAACPRTCSCSMSADLVFSQLPPLPPLLLTFGCDGATSVPSFAMVTPPSGQSVALQNSTIELPPNVQARMMALCQKAAAASPVKPVAHGFRNLTIEAWPPCHDGDSGHNTQCFPGIGQGCAVVDQRCAQNRHATAYGERYRPRDEISGGFVATNGGGSSNGGGERRRRRAVQDDVTEIGRASCRERV